MDYHEIPTKRKQLTLTVLTLIIYWLILWHGQIVLPELRDDLRLAFARYGIICLFTSGLLAGLSFYWGGKVRYNKELANSEISDCENTLDILRNLHKELGTDFSVQIKKNESRCSLARKRLSEAEKHPSFIEFSGCVSIFVLAVGTFFCFHGVG